MDVKFGKLSGKFSVSSPRTGDENLFASNPKQNPQPQQNKHPKNSNSSRLNDYDSTIMEKNAYQNLSDEMLKIECKIGILENDIAKIQSEIETLKEFGNFIQVSQLITRKKALEKEIEDLNKEYSELGISARISGHIASVVNFTSGKKLNGFQKFKKFISKKILAKISKKFGYSQNMKEAVEKLSMINSNVDELINIQTPYGETKNRYEELTVYLDRANRIQSELARNVNNLK